MGPKGGRKEGRKEERRLNSRNVHPPSAAARRAVVVLQIASVGIPVRSLPPSKATAPSSSICGYGSDASKAHKSNISSELRERE